ncbi:MAG: uncharacterized protein QOH24_1912 [Verrucomicrobiota bacterium]|jgi:uncharacterized protein YcgI (DUF1989 family)
MQQRLEPQTGTAFQLNTNQFLIVTDVEGEQVADLTSFNAHDVGECLSSGRSIDYANTIYLSSGNILYSNRSRPMFMIVSDDVGRHDLLLTPCSEETFRIIYKASEYHPSCLENLAASLSKFGIERDSIAATFNIFMNVAIKPDGVLDIQPPLSKPGDKIVFRAEMDLIVGLSACSAEMSNNYRFKPILYEIREGD